MNTNSNVTSNEMSIVPASQAVQPMEFNYDNKIANLSESDRAKYLNLAKDLNIHDTNTIQSYGLELSATVARTSDAYLKSVLSSSNNAVLGHLNALSVELTGFEDNLNRYNGIHKSALKRFWYSLPGIKKMARSLDLIKTEYNDVASNVDGIAQKLSTAKTVVIRDNSTLQQLSETNKQYVESLRDLVIAAKLEDEEISKQIEQMYTEGAEAIEIQQALNFQKHLRRRIDDLSVSAYVFYKNLFEIEVLKEGNNVLIEEANNAINHMIPMWKSQLPLSIMIKNQQTAADAFALTREATKKIILQTSQDIEKQAERIAKDSNTPSIDPVVLQQSTNSLVKAITNIQNAYTRNIEDQRKLNENIENMSKQLQNAVHPNIA